MEAIDTVEEYISRFPPKIRQILEQIRETIRNAAPDADEKISYGMPTFTLAGNLVHFAAFKTHIGFYPVPGGVEAFKDRLAGYRSGKGSVRFPLNEPMPLELIRDVVGFRVRENLERAGKKKASRTSQSGPVFLAGLSAPASRALAGRGIATAAQLAAFTEKEILDLHGIGKSSIPILKKALADAGLDFRAR
ncbi:MAG TPA: DUF1801 domain-containing protein [Sphingobacteriaceae bacterium]